MASVKRWVILALLGCAALALAYLPPRGARSRGTDSVYMARAPQGTPARRRAQALAEEWRGADAALHLLRTRRQLQDRLRQAASSGGSLVVMTESSGVLSASAQLVDSAMRVAWQQLGLGETKVKVAVVVELAPSTVASDRPLTETEFAAYLAPDSTDRTTCVAVVPVGRYWTRVISGELRDRAVPFDGPLVQVFKAGLGPCAFYAVYGTPGKPVRRWLVTRGWDLALSLDPGPRGTRNSWIGRADQRYRWYWDAVYSLPPSAVSCLARRPAGCRAAVLAGASEDLAIPVPDIMRIDRRWGRTERLVEAQRFLADVAHEVGPERFLTFWTSALPVDTALAAALKRPVGDWTAEWQRGFVTPIRLGPAPPMGAVALGLVLAVIALSLVVFTASRRQVR